MSRLEVVADAEGVCLWQRESFVVLLLELGCIVYDGAHHLADVIIITGFTIRSLSRAVKFITKGLFIRILRNGCDLRGIRSIGVGINEVGAHVGIMPDADAGKHVEGRDVVEKTSLSVIVKLILRSRKTFRETGDILSIFEVIDVRTFFLLLPPFYGKFLTTWITAAKWVAHLLISVTYAVLIVCVCLICHS